MPKSIVVHGLPCSSDSPPLSDTVMALAEQNGISIANSTWLSSPAVRATKSHSSAMMEVPDDTERRLLLEQGRILLEHRTHPVNACRHQARLMHCGTCQRYRHVARSCRARQAVCRLCAQKHHTNDHSPCSTCPGSKEVGCVHDRRLCVNCAGPHAAGDALCPSHINETAAVEALNHQP
jgi:hypothetical protein